MDTARPEVILVTNSIYPYHLHNVAILALPFGATYRFRYEHRYFDFDPEGIANLKGRAGVLVLRDFERSTFIPLRLFRIHVVDDCGEFVFLDLEFLNFVRYSSSASELEAGAPGHSDELRDDRERYSGIIATRILALNLKNEKREPLVKLIMRANPMELERIHTAAASEGPEFAEAWARVVNVLGGMPVYERVCFYSVSNVVELNSGRNAGRFRDLWRAGLVLETAKVYTFFVYQMMANRVAPPKPGYKIRLSGIEGHLSLMRSEEPIDGAYDRLNFLVYVAPQERERNASQLLLTCDQTLPDPNNPSMSSPIPSSPIPLRIAWPLWNRAMKWAGYPAIFIAGAGLFLMADKIAARLGEGDIGKYLIQLLGLSFLAIGGKSWGFVTGAFKAGPPGTRA